LCSSYFPLGVSQLPGHNNHQLHASHQSPILKQRTKKPAVKVLAVKRPMKKGSLASINAAAIGAPEAGGEHAREVFVEMPKRYALSFSLRSELQWSLILCAAM
jgi:hypothetical protein